MAILRRFLWWLRGPTKEAQLREELQFHLEQEARERREAGLPDHEARSAAHRDLGNEVRVREDVRTVWTWRPLEEVSQDVRYAMRTMFKYRAVSVFAVLSLALGIGANTAIYSFMDAILLRSLPVPDPAALVHLTWHAKPINTSVRGQFVLRSIDGSFVNSPSGASGRIFPFVAFERLATAAPSVLTSLFAHFPAGRINVMVNGEAQLTSGQYVSGDFFAGVGIEPAAGRLIGGDDDRPGAAPVAVLSHGYSERRFGAAGNAVGEPIRINNVVFTVIGVAPPEFFGVDPAAAPGVYLPLGAMLLFDRDAAVMFEDPNYYWAGLMGRVRPGVTYAQAEAALAPIFSQWVAPTAENDAQRANLPWLRVEPGAGGLDTLRRRYSKPLYLLMAMVGLILAIACANTANLLLARAATRRREIAVRLSIGAGRARLIRQLLTESIVLASIAGALGIVIAVAGMRLLTGLLANGVEGFTLHAQLNWNVLVVTIGLSVLCGLLFGLAPAIQSTRPALVPALKDGHADHSRARRRNWLPRLRVTHALVVSQISLLMLLLLAAGLFMRTLTNLQAVPLGFNPDHVLMFEVNAPQAGYPAANAAGFYADVRRRLSEIPGVRAVTLSHASLIRAGRGHTVRVAGAVADGTRFLQTGPGFFSTMQIPILQGREIDERDREGSLPVVVISDLFARTFLPNQNPLGRRLTYQVSRETRIEVEVIGVAATARYGPAKTARNLRAVTPPVIYVPYSQLPGGQLEQMVYALRTDGDPMRYVGTVREIVRAADARVPMTNIKTQAADIAQTINQEIVLARLGTAFAALALLIACVGLYGTMAYSVARRTREIGIRMALGARRIAVTWMVLREVCVLTALGLLISIPVARAASTFVTSFLFDTAPGDPVAIAIALSTLLAAALVASYAPARRATRIDPTTALREE